jgi:hypothetical protein
MSKKAKLIILFSGFLLLVFQWVAGQDFYGDYRSYLTERSRTHNVSTNKSIDVSINYLRRAINTFNKNTEQSFLACDTFYMVSFLDFKNTPLIGWNKNGSWQRTYNKSYGIGTGVFYKDLKIKTDASDILKKMPARLKLWIMNADTANFTEQAKTVGMLKSSALSFTRAIKNRHKWKFISATSYTIDL